ncbi:MAG: hypothetical protein OIN89_04925 [Candidatus Methanoperedens sp.]|jgi:hypothetical protein|nr:hypothetical protein [Candidatus Methanoperedens sp.]PKL52808.1 MAG: hypothetical protein CVV36_10495 [Candidatus Methanoperedenaceae archaeon HGW-Methanoperedenaceae-1]
MNDRAVIDIIKKIFIFKGYSVTSSGISDMVAENNNEKLFIKYEPSTNINNARYFAADLKRSGGKGILISDNFDDRTQRFAFNEGITVWDRKELESWIGEAVLSGALSGDIEPEPLVEETAASMFGADMFSAFRPHVSGEPVKNEPATLPVKEEYEKTIRLSLASVPLNIGKSDASSIAKEKISNVKSQKLKFIPIWYYRYSFSTQKKYKSKTIDMSGEGEGCIDGLTSEPSGKKYSDILDNTFVPTRNYEIVKPAVEKKDASARALEAIIRDNTREERINEMIGDTIVFQQKVFAPDPQAVTLEMELIHIPVWEIEGDNKILEINAHDGHISEKNRKGRVEPAGKGHIIDSDERVTYKEPRSKITYDDAEFV